MMNIDQAINLVMLLALIIYSVVGFYAVKQENKLNQRWRRQTW